MRTPLAASYSGQRCQDGDERKCAPLDRFISRRAPRELSIVYDLGRGASPARASVAFGRIGAARRHWAISLSASLIL